MGEVGTHWCENCNVPLAGKRCEICGASGKFLTNTGLKPVFPPEKKIYVEIFEKHLDHSVNIPDDLYRSRNRLYHGGNILGTLVLDGPELVVNGKKSVIEKRIDAVKENRGFEESLNLAVKANEKRLIELEKEAVRFIKRADEENSEKKKYISFSGGKDSAAVAYLVKKSIGNIPLLFVNTTIELPETVDYVKRFSEELGLELVEVTPPRPFMELVDEFGPPSRMMRWCCFTQKSAPVSELYSGIDRKILSFDGIRKAEAQAREKYKRERNNTKISKQRSAYPILEWADLEVWLYTRFRSIPLNPLYRQGRSRVGCWPCPNNGKLSNFFTKKVHPELIDMWEKKLFRYAKQNGKDEDWVRNGKWQSRKTKHDDTEGVNKKSLCGGGNEYSYDLRNTEVTEEMVQFLKIFGEYEERKFDGTKLVRITGGDIQISTILGSSGIRIKFKGEKPRAEQLVKKQIEKSLNCAHCGACLGACPESAISINPEFHIDETICTGCQICATGKYLKQACAALHYKSNRNISS